MKKSHSFSPEIAQAYGLPAALVVQYIEYCWQRAAIEKKNCLFRERRYWCPIRMEDILRQYPYLGTKSIRNALRRLLNGHKDNPPLLRRIRNCFYAATGDSGSSKGRHKFDPLMAKRYGLIEAILLHNLWHWCHHNFDQAKMWIDEEQKAKDYDYDNDKADAAATEKALGKAWHYVTTEKLWDNHPYVSRATVFRALAHLQGAGVLRKKYLGAVRVLRIPSWSFAPRFIQNYHNHPECRPSQDVGLHDDQLSQSQKGHPQCQNGQLQSQNGHPQSQKRHPNQPNHVATEPLPEPLKAVDVKSESVKSEKKLKAESVADTGGSGCAVATAVRQQELNNRFAVKKRAQEMKAELQKHSPEFRKAFEEYNGLLQSSGCSDYNQVELTKAATRFYEVLEAENERLQTEADRRRNDTGTLSEAEGSNSTDSSVKTAPVAPQARKVVNSGNDVGSGAQRQQKPAPPLKQMWKKHQNQTRKKQEEFNPKDYGDFEPERMRKITAWEKKQGIHWSCWL